MRKPQLAWLLAGFLAITGRVQAQDFTVGGWTFDTTCAPYADYVTKGIQDALQMVTKAQADLNLVLPRFEKKANPLQTEQYRIARAMGRCFGFMPDDKKDNTNAEKYWSKVFQIYDALVLGLQGPGVTHQFGHNLPLIICQDDVWVWYGGDDFDPETPDLDAPEFADQDRAELEEAFKLKNRYPDRFADGYVGGWYYRQRMDWRKRVAKNPPGQACMDGAMGRTIMDLDVIHICSTSFQETSTGLTSPVDVEPTRDETKLGYFDPCLSNTLVHEFTHWYGSSNDGPGTPVTKQLPDQQSLNDEGKWVYKKKKDGSMVYKKNKMSEKDRKGKYTEDVTYGYKDVSNLAKKWPNENGGPKYATDTAEAYAYFAMMSIMDGVDWAKDGKARKKFYKKMPSLPLKLRV
ncbi:hypothetical protein ACHAPT_000700 [Fusarium lateritium]